MPPTLPYWLAALYLPNIGLRKIKHCLTAFGTINEVFNASITDLMQLGLSAKDAETVAAPNWVQVEKDLAWAQTAAHHLICLDDPGYPRLLKETASPPFVLFVQGDPHLLSQPQIAIVGSRNASVHGLKNAEQFAACLVQAGIVVTSGLALGIDAASHHGALSVKGKTIGVAGTGLLHCYPRTHQSLVATMTEQGSAVISEFPLQMAARADHFPRRNRIIAGLSMGVLVVEAALKSGSLITARIAVEEGREVFAIPSSIHHPLAKGCHHLIRQGAKLVESASDIIEELGPLLSANNAQVSTPKVASLAVEALPTTAQQVLAQINYEVTPINVILLRSELTAPVVSSLLLTLELKGYIQSVTGGYIRLIA